MSEKNARAIPITNRTKSSDTQSEFSIKELAERVLCLLPFGPIDSRTVDFSKIDVVLSNKVANAAFDPLITAKKLVVAKGSFDSRSDVVNALADALQEVSTDELHRFDWTADVLTTYDPQNELSRFFLDCSLLAAMVARDVARGLASVLTDRAFLSGLLSEVGALSCLKVDTSGFEAIWNQSGGLPVRRADLEIERYGGTTHELGGELLVRSRFPADVSDAVATRVNETVRTLNPLSRITAFSRTVSTELIRCTRRKHEQNLIRSLPKFDAYFNLTVDRELLTNRSIAPLIYKEVK